MRLIKKLNWRDPLSTAAEITKNAESWILLYSGINDPHRGRYSILALNKQEEISGSFLQLEKKLTKNNDKFSNAWFGYLGYGLKNQLEILSPNSPSYINADDLWFAKFATIFVFDHENQLVEIWSENKNIDILQEYKKSFSLIKNNFDIKNLSSNMTRREYLGKVSNIKEAIKKGDIYQANLTRKFFGEIKGEYSAFDIFRNLCVISPAPYSAFIKHGELEIISSSPELFLSLDKDGKANIRPIKGSIARHNDKEKDAESVKTLTSSEKDRAENLMIVDLSRNDLARNCVTGSVKVDELFSIESYSTVHHMVSSVTGQKKEESSAIDLIKGCFPPGSMTGTPKIKAMEICSELENMGRGIYSGTIGFLGGDGSADLSVVIRTIIIKGNKFEFQVGGAIVYDSTPQQEFAETMVKATGVAAALGIEISQLEKL